MPRLLLTNDDGIDSVGLHVLARAMQTLGDVVVVAPDQEYSGAGAALGALHLIRPDVHKVRIDGVNEAWTVAGPPALCTRFALQGVFGGDFDMVVAGINPGANTSMRTPYHSGTIGATLTGRNMGLTGVAVSQDVTVGAIEGQAWEDMLIGQRWETAAAVAVEVVSRLLNAPPVEPSVLNVNVPNLPVEELLGYRATTLAPSPGRRMEGLELTPIPGHQDAFHATLRWGQRDDFDAHTDTGAVRAGYVSLTWLSRIVEVATPTRGLDDLISPH